MKTVNKLSIRYLAWQWKEPKHWMIFNSKLQLQAHSFSVEWQRWYEEIRIFKSRNGHYIVLWRFIHNKALGGRVATQWKQYKLMSGNKSPSMKMERAQALKDIWYKWKLQAHSVTVEWQSRYSTIILWRQMMVACDGDERNQCQWRMVAMTVACDVNKWRREIKVTNEGDYYWHWHKTAIDGY